MEERKRLFPVFDVPAAAQKSPARKQKYRPSLKFDFETGDLVRDGAGNLVTVTGREAYAQWCRKMAVTERLACLAYGGEQGAELQAALGQPDRAALESALERTITEALKVNPCTEYVRGFAFGPAPSGAGLMCTFTVKGRDWEEFPVSVLVKGG